MLQNEIQWEPFRMAFPMLFDGKGLISSGVGNGWSRIVWDLCMNLEETAREQSAAGLPVIRILQVKTQDGVLCFLLENPTESSLALTHRAIAQSRIVCEVCGEAGVQTSLYGWFRTLCAAHASAWTRWTDDPVDWSE